MSIRAGVCKWEGKAGELGGAVSTEGRDSTGKQAGGTREKGGRMDRDPFAQPLEFRLEAKVLAKG